MVGLWSFCGGWFCVLCVLGGGVGEVGGDGLVGFGGFGLVLVGLGCFLV